MQAQSAISIMSAHRSDYPKWKCVYSLLWVVSTTLSWILKKIVWENLILLINAFWSDAGPAIAYPCQQPTDWLIDDLVETWMIWPLLIGILIKCWWIHWCWSKVKVEVVLAFTAVNGSLQKLSKVWTACNNCLSLGKLVPVVYAVNSLWKLSKLSTNWNCSHQ